MKTREGWREARVGEIADISSGEHLKRSQYDPKGRYPVLGANGKIGRTNKYLFDKKVIFTGRVGTLGNIFISNGKAYLSDNTLILEPTNSDFHYLYYFLKNTKLQNLNVGSTQPLIRQSDLKEVAILLPPLPEQKAIAEVLSSLDDKIDLLHRQNKTLEDMAQTLFRKWFVEDADEGWGVGVVPDEFDFKMGQSPPGDSYNEEATGIPMFQGNADFGYRFPRNRVYTTEPKRFAERFDTLISVRAPVGEQNMAMGKCCIGRGVASFNYKHNPNFYTYTYFKLKSLMGKIKRFNNEGTIFGSISKTDFLQMEIVLTPKESVKQFEREAKPINDKIMESCAQIDTLENLRDALLPRLMSGHLRV